MHYKESLQDFSLYYFLVDSFAATPFVKVVAEYPAVLLDVPCISFENVDLYANDFEMGNKQGLEQRLYRIDVFATNKTQRDEFAYKIFNELGDSIKVYDYNQGFPPTIVPAVGCLIPVEKRIEFVKIYPELTDKLYYRATIRYVANYQDF